jgi:hypothetical protein
MKRLSIIIILNWHFFTFCQISPEMSRAFQSSIDSSICFDRFVASLDYGPEKQQLCYFIKLISCTDKSIMYSFSREVNEANIFAVTDLKYSFNKFGDVLIFNNSTKIPYCNELPEFTKRVADSLIERNEYILYNDFYNYQLVGNYYTLVIKLKKIARLKYEHTIKYYYQYRFVPPCQRPLKFVDTPFFRIDSTLSISDPVPTFKKYFPKGKITPEYYEDRFVFKIKPF